MKWLAGQRLQYFVGFSPNETTAAKINLIPESAWTPADNAEQEPRDGAWVTN